MKTTVLALAVLGMGLAGGSYAVVAHQADDKTAPPAAVAAQPPKITALGRVEPVSRVIQLTGPTGAGAGRIASIRIAEGDWVQSGDLLAILDTEPALGAAVQQAEATVTIKRAQLVKTITDIENQDKVLAATLAQQTAERDRTQWEFDKMAKLQASGLYNKNALTDKRLALAAASRQLETARLALERNRAKDKAGLRVDEANARADLASAEAALTKARADHAQAFIRAPISGRILRLIGRPGEQIGTDGFAELGDTSTMMVRAEVFEADIRYVAEGKPAEITSRSLDGVLAGKIDRIGLRVGKQSVIREDPAAVLDASVIEVLVRLDAASSKRVEGLSNLQVRVSMPRTTTAMPGVPVALAATSRD